MSNESKKTTWTVPKDYTVPEPYSVPFPYSIPSDYTVPDVFEEIATETTQTATATKAKKSEKKWEIDPLTVALITTGMVALFGGVMAGRKSKEVKKTKW